MMDKNKIRIIKQGHGHVFNMMMIGDYARAGKINDKLTAIIKYWARQKVNARIIGRLRANKLTAV